MQSIPLYTNPIILHGIKARGLEFESWLAQQQQQQQQQHSLFSQASWG